MTLKQTPSQTVGPYFAYGLTPQQYGYELDSLADSAVARSDTDGERIRIEGRVYDGEGNPIPDAMIEIWQADAQGRYAHPADGRASNAAFKGFGRCGTGTDPDNRFWFDTVKPASVDGAQAPHVNVIVFMRGMLVHADLFCRRHRGQRPGPGAAIRPRRAPQDAAGRAHCRPHRHHLPLRHPHAGRRRDGVLRRVNRPAHEGGRPMGLPPRREGV